MLTWTYMLTWSPAVLTVSVVKKRCISRSAKQKMQSAVASIHQLQAISCCKQKSRPAVDTTGGSVFQTQATVDQLSSRKLQRKAYPVASYSEKHIQSQATVIQSQAKVKLKENQPLRIKDHKTAVARQGESAVALKQSYTSCCV
ncbi:hypothetical protein F511_41404 [Dorcoceras hygrometricum]|uniref:Uncharacterized protein n=1 Tax=Dorcoceras hygrometricum TaxID=472368 RepID=A0A2Z7DBW4_9LAMI|nr:hypothetical protein F511_41404 [Dorcoceras hygrometricum]